MRRTPAPAVSESCICPVPFLMSRRIRAGSVHVKNILGKLPRELYRPDGDSGFPTNHGADGVGRRYVYPVLDFRL